MYIHRNVYIVVVPQLLLQLQPYEGQLGGDPKGC